MSAKREQYHSEANPGTLVMVIQEFDCQCGSLSPAAVDKVTERCQKLHTVSVLMQSVEWEKNRLLMVLYIPNDKLTEEMVRIRIDDYMDYLNQELGLHVWHRCGYSGEDLRNISSFMHDFIWQICRESYLLNNCEGLRPRAKRRYACVELNPQQLPEYMTCENLCAIREKLTKLAPGMSVRQGSNMASNGKIMGEVSDFESAWQPDGGYEQEYVGWTDLYHRYKYEEGLYEEKVKNATDNLFSELVETITFESNSSTMLEADTELVCKLMMSPILLSLLLVSKGVKYWLYRRMKKDGTLERFRQEAEDEARESRRVYCRRGRSRSSGPVYSSDASPPEL